MPTDPRLLTLVQWLSPAFPIGAFAYSHGLESAIAAGWVADAEGLESWLRDCLEEGSGRSDAIFLRAAFDAGDPGEVNATARSFAMSAERLREAERQGAAFVLTANGVWGFDMPPLLLPVAVGHGARLAGLDVEDTVALYLHAFMSNLVSAAIRLMPLGQTAGQRVLHNLHATCLAVADETRGAVPENAYGAAFLSDVSAMKHETLEPRLFQS
ncbi:MAG: urease accessory protein UreF [Silicimonas sp.]|nr:urease accessory protein UreF [Silicimonas sp.]